MHHISKAFVATCQFTQEQAMFKKASFLLLLPFLALIDQGKGKPGLLDIFSSSECKPITDDSCAIVYDDEDCEEGMKLFQHF